MPIPTRPLGTSGLAITPVGLGSWAIGGNGGAYGWGPQDDEQSIATMRHAIERGINWIDTAPIYGLGHSEEVLGRMLRQLAPGERPFVFTKCGLLWDDADRTANPKRFLGPASIRAECEASLRRLGVERIDLFQFHWPDDAGTPVEESWETMVRLVEEGKVRAIGVSNFNPTLLGQCEAIRHVDSVQPPFSLIRRDAGGTVIPWAEAHRTGVIVYSPMQAGILTERFSVERTASLAPDDWRRGTREYQMPNAGRNVVLRDAIRPVAQRHGTTVSAVAIAWTLTWPGVTGAIAGGRSPEQVDGWIDAATLKLTAADVAELTAAVERSEAGTGPVRPGAATATKA